ncbi:MAG: HlyD family efflux transporter periplasmic adaptor subunit [Acidobacteria bacterium]|nr:HlyD family efflux transporter periplasmic adaptor subunit [Acidobacteriota bacterium]
MDIQRKGVARRRLLKGILIACIAAAAIGGSGWYVSRLQPAAPSVERDSLWIDVVKRGSMLRQVRGLGSLVPEDTRWITAVTEGRVERKLVEPGAQVFPDTILLELSNPRLEQETLNAEWDWKAAQKSYSDLEVNLESQRLGQEATVASIEADYKQALLRAEANAELSRQGLYPELNLKVEKAAAEQLANRLEIERKRLDIFRKSIELQLEAKETRISQSRAFYELRKSQLDQLKVRAGVSGVLQLLPVQLGEQVGPGANLARVADPTRLKAELKIAETQAKDIQIGQEASIDTRSGIIPGRVARIDPAVADGTVTVDVALEGDLPKGARPDQTVDGTIVLENLTDIVYVGRPVRGSAETSVSLFKLEPDEKHAVRIIVQLGRTSVNSIEIRDGLSPGDKVILSDMAAQDGFDRIRLN